MCLSVCEVDARSAFNCAFNFCAFVISCVDFFLNFVFLFCSLFEDVFNFIMSVCMCELSVLC